MFHKILFNKKPIKIFIFLLVLGVAISMIGAEELLAGEQDNINLFELAFTNRSPLIRGETDYNLTRNALADYLFQFERAELEALPQSNYLELLSKENIKEISSETITIEEAREDVAFLFETLKFGYAGYQIFGGEERFEQARQEIIADLEDRTADGKKILLSEFEDILYSGLNFIEDTHFGLAGRQMGVDYTLYVNNEYKFNQVRENGRKYYVLPDGEGKFVSLGEKGSEEALWPFLTEKGELVYLPGVLKPKESSCDDSIRDKIQINSLEGKSAAIIDLLLDPLSSGEQAQKAGIYRRSEIEGIPLIEVSSFAARDDNSFRQLQEFVTDAAHLKDFGRLIIDIRGNTGGSDQYPYEWMQSFTGREDISRNSLAINLRTDFSAGLMNNVLKLFPADQQEQLKQQLEDHLNPTDSGWGEVHTAVPQFIPGETKVVVLIDSRVMSAAESFVRYLQQLENVIFIGSNTRGMGLIGNVGRFNLINSGIEVLGGITIFMDTDLEYREGRGYMPDFWVENSRAKDIAVEILSAYN